MIQKRFSVGFFFFLDSMFMLNASPSAHTSQAVLVALEDLDAMWTPSHPSHFLHPHQMLKQGELPMFKKPTWCNDWNQATKLTSRHSAVKW